MSDFLNKFSSDNYKNNNTNTTSANSDKSHDRELEESLDKVSPVSNQTISNEENKSYTSQDVKTKDNVDEIVDTKKLSNLGAEEYVKDEEYSKNLALKRIIMIVSCILGCVVFLIVLVLFLTTRMPSFSETKTIDEMKLWALQNKITLNVKEEFSLVFKEGIIIDQGKEPNTLVRKGSTFDVVVSKGADPDERITLPDFSKMSLQDIEKWKLDNRADNVSVVKEFSSDVPKDAFIRDEIKSQEVTVDTYTRKDRMTLYISKGEEVFEKNIVVPDFVNKPRAEVEAWATKEGIDMKYNEAASDTVMEDAIISQSIAPEEKIAKNDEMTVTVSVGRIQYAPSFYSLSQDDALALSMQKGVSVTVVEKFSSTHAAGVLISQSIAPRFVIPQNESTIVLVYSIGLPYIDDFRGQSHQVAVDAINQMNAQGANITYNIVTIQDASMDKGFVIMMTPSNGFVGVGTSITITISAGGQAVIPDLVGKLITSQEMIDFMARFEAQGLRVVTQYLPNADYPVGTIFEQSIKANANVNTSEVFLVIKIAN